jgi:hypothetical protein
MLKAEEREELKLTFVTADALDTHEQMAITSGLSGHRAVHSVHGFSEEARMTATQVQHWVYTYEIELCDTKEEDSVRLLFAGLWIGLTQAKSSRQDGQNLVDAKWQASLDVEVGAWHLQHMHSAAYRKLDWHGTRKHLKPDDVEATVSEHKFMEEDFREPPWTSYEYTFECHSQISKSDHRAFQNWLEGYLEAVQHTQDIEDFVDE